MAKGQKTRIGRVGDSGLFWLEFDPEPNFPRLGSFHVVSPFAAEFPYAGVRIEAVVEDGQAVCVAISRLDGAPPLTSQRLRDPALNINALLTEALRFNTYELVRRRPGDVEPELEVLLGHETDEDGYLSAWLPLQWRAATGEAKDAQARSQRRGRPTGRTPHGPDFLRTVAECYLSAKTNHRQHVAKHFRYSDHTVSKWLKRCEEEGLLTNEGQGRPRGRGPKLGAALDAS